MTTNVILVIDDDKVVRNTLILVLARMGFMKILPAGDGKEGIGLIEAYNPNLVFADYEMPRMGGKEVIDWIRLNDRPAFPKIKIIAMSGSDHREEVESIVMAAGADDFLPKPFDLAKLRDMVQTLLTEA